MRRDPTTPAARPTGSPEQGFSLIEVVVGVAILAIALLGHTASIFSEHRLSKDERARSAALEACEQFMERLRSDDDWVALYSRCRTLEALAANPGGDAYLLDGRRVFVPQVYYADFITPRALSSLHVLVDVPQAPLDAAPSGPAVLREDVVDPAFGLPQDLNGDGLLDGEDHAGDYLLLPVVARFRWTHPGEAPEEMRVACWLWGSR